jgi:hypothetical protein
MKSERRHELQHNELAEWLAKSFETIKPYQNIILAAVLVVLIAMLGYTLLSRQSAAQATEAWDELNTVIEGGNVAKLAQVIDSYPDTNVAHTAAVVLADDHLGEGCRQLFVNKATARDELSKAVNFYESVRKKGPASSLLERATFGLARAKEAKGELGPAEQLYEEVAAKWPKGTYAAAASQRAADLKRPATKSFYDQFAKFDPKPAFSGGQGERPSFDLNSVPDDAPVYTPGAFSKLKLEDADTRKEKAKGGEKKPPAEAGKK